VRALIVCIILLATARTALACPRGARCVIEAVTIAEVPGPKRPLRLHIEHVDTREPLWTFEASNKTEEPVVPKFWQTLREQAYARMPHYRGDDGLTFTLSPVVVTASAFDTVPGIGIAGDF
jgi:hypothetical protein